MVNETLKDLDELVGTRLNKKPSGNLKVEFCDDSKDSSGIEEEITCRDDGSITTFIARRSVFLITMIPIRSEGGSDFFLDSERAGQVKDVLKVIGLKRSDYMEEAKTQWRIKVSRKKNVTESVVTDFFKEKFSTFKKKAVDSKIAGKRGTAMSMLLDKMNTLKDDGEGDLIKLVEDLLSVVQEGDTGEAKRIYGEIKAKTRNSYLKPFFDTFAEIYFD